MAFKKTIAAAAASLILAGTASAQALPSRSTVSVDEENEAVAPLSPLVIVGGIIGAVAILEITGAIDIFDDDPDSP